jgi:hypothetical protein
MRGLGRLSGSLSAYSNKTFQTPLITAGDAPLPVVSGKDLATRRALENNGTVVPAAGKFGRKSGYMVMTNQAVRGAGAAAIGSRILGILGPVAMIASVAMTVGPLIARLVKSNEDISDNTKKQISQELNYPLFTSEALSSNVSS